MIPAHSVSLSRKSRSRLYNLGKSAACACCHARKTEWSTCTRESHLPSEEAHFVVCLGSSDR
jgi:hypothetical protein